MKKVMFGICAIMMSMLSLGSLVTASPVYADPPAATGKNPAQDLVDKVTPSDDVTKTGKSTSLTGIIGDVINVILGLVGVIAVVMMIIGGINFITSQGDANKVTKARNTILYGVVGLVVALLAFAIVNFVLDGVFKTA